MKVSQHYTAKRSYTLPAFSLQPQESVCCVHDEIIPLIKLAGSHIGVQGDYTFYGDLGEIMVIMLLVCDRLDKIPLVCKLKQL